MHTVFRIGELELIEDRLWFVNLTSTNDDDEQLHRLTEYIRTETKELTAKHRLGVMMIKMGEFDNAQLLFQTLLETESNDDWADQAHLHQQLGSVLQSKGDGLQALSNYYKTLQLIQINNISDYPLVATTYNHIALQQNFSEFKQSDLAITYNNIGAAFQSKGEDNNALLHYEKSLNILEKSLPSTHPDIATALNNIGTLYYRMGDLENAQRYHLKALQIQEKVLTPTHIHLAATYNNLGLVHDLMGDHSSALLFFEKALRIRQAVLPCNHLSIAETYDTIGGVHRFMGDYPTAISYHTKSLEIKIAILPSNHLDLCTTYNSIGLACKLSGDYATGLSYYEKQLVGDYSIASTYYEKALEIQQKMLPSNHLDLATTYINIGSIHYTLGYFTKAFSYYKQALNIRQNMLPSIHSDQATAFKCIGDV
ncbi:unnamed protein product, partial [Rotaria magnacalcarata]